MNNRFAFFDIDGTIYNGNITLEFYSHLISEGFFHQDINVQSVKLFIEYKAKQISYNQMAIEFLTLCANAFKGKQKSEIEQLHKTFFQEHNNVFFWTKDLFAYLKEQGFTIIMLSASLSFLLTPLEGILAPDILIGSMLETDGDIFTGNLSRILNQEEKQKEIQAILTKTNGENIIFCFGDSSGDSEMLQMGTQSFLINPHEETLIRLGEEKGWKKITEMNEAFEEITTEITKFVV